jgi:hypothetical protein
MCLYDAHWLLQTLGFNDMKELNKELKEELAIIEDETDFFLTQPIKPQSINFFSGLLTLVFAICIAIMFYKNTSSPMPYVFLIILINSIISYIYQKQLYQNHKTAYRIINFYKNKSSSHT